MEGFDNWFVIQKIYGEDFTFLNAEIMNAKADGLCGTLELELQVSDIVKCPPKRWKKWDKTYITIEFFCVKSITMSIINGEHLVISSFSTKRINNNYNYILEIACGDDVIICHYDVARIQKITPLIWNEEFRSYEVSN